jgi:hypothetical protein
LLDVDDTVDRGGDDFLDIVGTDGGQKWTFWGLDLSTPYNCTFPCEYAQYPYRKAKQRLIS